MNLSMKRYGLADRQGDILQFCVAYTFVVAVCH